MIIRPSGPSTIEEALAVLRAGGCVAHATETCYGFACDLANPAAVMKLFAIKQRPADQPVSALFASLDDAKRHVIWNDRAEELATRHLPGPLTLILPVRSDAPHQLYSTPRSSRSDDSRIVATVRTLGLRLSSHPLAQELVLAFGSPLSTTSANVHGEPNPYDAQKIFERFETEEHRPDLIIDSGRLRETPPSTVMDLTRGGVIPRRGEILPERKQ